MKWSIKSSNNKEAIKKIAEELKLPEKVAEVFVMRGKDSPEKVKKFLDFNEKDIPDALIMQDLEKAVDIILETVALGLHIVVEGDYDGDGVSATSVLVKALRHLGANIDYFTNNRFKEGFGLKKESIDQILAKFPDVKLIITVDNGIVAFEAADYAKEKGIDLIITDHHEPDASGEIPNALAVVDPKRKDDKYPFKELCGVGVIYRLLLELYKKKGEDLSYMYSLLPLVALGTITDCMSMTDENRYYVKEGLKKMGEDSIPGFAVLSNLFKVKQYNEDTVGYYYGPMINSSSRLDGDAYRPIELFVTEDYDKAQKLGEYLYDLNNLRKEKTTIQTEKAFEIIEAENKTNDDVIIVYDSSFDEGIVGIIAGRITEQLKKPSVVFTDNNGFIKGSARSVEGFNIKEAFDELADLTIGYGGHAMAAGISMEKGNLGEFNKEINKLAKGNIPEASDEIIVELNLDNPNEIDTVLLDSFNEYLRPFGTDWPVVKTRVGGWNISDNYPYNDIRYLKDIHLKITNRDINKNTDYSLLMFNNGVEFYENLVKDGNAKCLEAIGDFDINVFKGNVSYQLIVKDNQLRIEE